MPVALAVFYCHIVVVWLCKSVQLLTIQLVSGAANWYHHGKYSCFVVLQIATRVDSRQWTLQAQNEGLPSCLV